MKRVLYIVMLLACSGVHAVESFKATQEEAQVCQARNAVQDLKDGSGGIHMHHYCDCIRFYERARQSMKPEDRLYNINVSIGGCDYVLQHASDTYSRRPEVLVIMGRSLDYAGRREEAANAYNQALALDPNFAMAYGALGNVYKKLGDREQATSVYREGLRRNPTNRYLKSRLKDLGLANEDGND